MKNNLIFMYSFGPVQVFETKPQGLFNFGRVQFYWILMGSKDFVGPFNSIEETISSYYKILYPHTTVIEVDFKNVVRVDFKTKKRR